VIFLTGSLRFVRKKTPVSFWPFEKTATVLHFVISTGAALVSWQTQRINLSSLGKREDGRDFWKSFFQTAERIPAPEFCKFLNTRS